MFKPTPKQLSENVYKYFKMDTLESALRLMIKDCFMDRVDLRNAYHTIPMKEWVTSA